MNIGAIEEARNAFIMPADNLKERNYVALNAKLFLNCLLRDGSYLLRCSAPPLC